MKTLVLAFTLFAFIFLGCNKEDDGFTPTLPPITQTGENTFGCYVNGVLITPRDGSGTFNVPDRGMILVAGPGPTEFSYQEIKVRDFASEKTARITLHLIHPDSISIGSYTINESNCMGNIDSPITNNVFCRIFDYEKGIYKEYCSFEDSGTINITRYENGVISGTFSCRVRNKNDFNDIIEITEGRFDLDGYTLPYANFP